jgi:hypothetical protein
MIISLPILQSVRSAHHREVFVLCFKNPIALHPGKGFSRIKGSACLSLKGEFADPPAEFAATCSARVPLFGDTPFWASRKGYASAAFLRAA